MSNPSSYLASVLFAQSQGSSCLGRWQCHWCGASCVNEFVHDDPPPVPFVRSYSTARCPSEAYICVGCWLWRRKRVTITHLDGEMLDGQEAKKHSWWITAEGAWAIQKDSFPILYRRLLSPPKYFCLAFRTPTVENLLQLMYANNVVGVLADTMLTYTLGNVKHQYCIYELEEAIKHGPAGVEPGVRILMEQLGPPPKDLQEELLVPEKEREAIIQKRGRGKPPPRNAAKDTVHKVILHSGNVPDIGGVN